jgi:hypothetical protein
MGACEITPPATAPGTSTRPPTANRETTLPRSLRIRRLPASSSFIIAAARLRALQLDSWPRGGKDQQLRGRIQKNSQPRPDGAPNVSHRVRFVCLLTVAALIGAANRAAAPGQTVSVSAGSASGCRGVSGERPYGVRAAVTHASWHSACSASAHLRARLLRLAGPPAKGAQLRSSPAWPRRQARISARLLCISGRKPCSACLRALSAGPVRMSCRDSGRVLWEQRLNIWLAFAYWRDGVASSEQKGIDRWQMNGMPR